MVDERMSYLDMKKVMRMIKLIKQEKYICTKTNCYFSKVPCTITKNLFIDNGSLVCSEYSETTNGISICSSSSVLFDINKIYGTHGRGAAS